MNVNERIEALRQLMAERNIDVYYVPNQDDHLSEEYTAAHFQCKSTYCRQLLARRKFAI